MMLKKLLSRIIVTLIMLVLLCYPLTACSKSDRSIKNKEDSSKSISIKYLGNACFYITFADGTRLVTDPYIENYATPKMDVDVMTISGTYEDHKSGIDYFTGTPKVINPEDQNKIIKVGDVEITGYAARHVADLGDDTIFVYKENGLKIVHMAETDNIESKEAQEAVKDADVILAYAGEYGDIKNKDSFETLINKLNIKVIIPQHYSLNAKIPVYNQPTIDKILTEIPEGLKVTKTDEVIVTKDMEKQFVAMSVMKFK